MLFPVDRGASQGRDELAGGIGPRIRHRDGIFSYQGDCAAKPLLRFGAEKQVLFVFG